MVSKDRQLLTSIGCVVQVVITATGPTLTRVETTAEVMGMDAIVSKRITRRRSPKTRSVPAFLAVIHSSARFVHLPRAVFNRGGNRTRRTSTCTGT